MLTNKETLHRMFICLLNTTTTPDIYTLSLHDALPISSRSPRSTPSGRPSVPRTRTPAATSPSSRHGRDRKSTRLNSSHRCISYAVFCLKKKKNIYRSVEHDQKTGLTTSGQFHHTHSQM